MQSIDRYDLPSHFFQCQNMAYFFFQARTPEHSEFEARRRLKEEVDPHISRMTNRNESTYNLKLEERDYLRRHQDTSAKFNIPPHAILMPKKKQNIELVKN